MPEDPTPDGQGILNKPAVQPFPEPTPGQQEKAQFDHDADDKPGRSLVTPDMEEPAETNRPPLGN